MGDRLFELFEKHQPGTRSRDDVQTILNENKGSEHECYVKQCEQFDENPLPKINDTIITQKQSKKKKVGLRLEDLLENDEHSNKKQRKSSNRNLNISKRQRPGPRKSIIGMLRKGLV